MKLPTAPDGWHWDADGDLQPDVNKSYSITIVHPKPARRKQSIKRPWGVDRTHQWGVVFHRKNGDATLFARFDTPEAAIASLLMADAQGLYE